MAKRLRNHTRIPLAEPDELTEGHSTRDFAHRRTAEGRTRVNNEERAISASDSSRERKNRKRQRNSEMYSTGRNANSARESRNRTDASSNRSHESAALLNIASTRGLTHSHSVLENGTTDLIKRAYELFNQTRTASQSMETLVSENENVLQEFKLFLEDNLPQSNGAKTGCAKCRECFKKDWLHSCRCHRDEIVDLQADRKRSQSSQTSVQLQNISQISTWPQELMSSLKCTICQDFCHQCVTACPCGHLFCGGCLSTWFDRCGEFKTCPTCRERVLSVHKNLPADHLIRNYLTAHPEEKRTEEELSSIQTQDRLFVTGVSIFRGGANVSEQRSQRSVDPPILYATDDDDDDDSDSSYDSVTLNEFGGMRNESTDSDDVANDHTFTHSRGNNQRQRTETQPVRATRASARLQSYTERSHRSPELAYMTRRALRNRQLASSRTADSPPTYDRSPEIASQGRSGIGCTLTTNQGPVRIRPGQWYHMPSNYAGESTIDITVDAVADSDRLSEASQDIVRSMLQEDDESALESVEELPVLPTENVRSSAQLSNEDHRTSQQRRTRRGIYASDNRGTQRRNHRNSRLRGESARHDFRHISFWNSTGLVGIEDPNVNLALDNLTGGPPESSTRDETTSNESEETSSSNRDSVLPSNSDNEIESASEEEDEPIQ